MKTLIYTEAYAYGGGVRYCLDFITSLLKIEQQIELLVNRDGRHFFSKCSIVPRRSFFISEKILRVGDWNNIYLNYISFFLKIILQPIVFTINILLYLPQILIIDCKDVFVFNGGYPASLSCLTFVVASRLCGKRVFLSVVSVPAKRSKLVWYYDFFIDKLIQISSHLIVVNCKVAKTEMVQHRGFLADKIEVIYNTVECLNNENQGIKNHNSQDLVIGFISRLDKNKGIYVLLAAFKKLVVDHKNIKLMIVGTGPESNAIDEYIKANNLTEYVEQVGFYSGSIYDPLSKIDIFVLPSFWEGFPYVLLEAANMNKCVIASNVGGIPEIIQHDETGLLVEPANIDELFSALQSLVMTKEKRLLLGNNLKKRYLKEFSKDQFILKINTILAGKND